MSLPLVHRMLLNSDDEKYSHFLINYSTTFLRYFTLTVYILPLFYLVIFHPSLHFPYFNCLLLFLDKSLHYTLPSFPPHSPFITSSLSLPSFSPHSPFLSSSLSLPFLFILQPKRLVILKVHVRYVAQVSTWHLRCLHGMDMVKELIGGLWVHFALRCS